MMAIKRASTENTIDLRAIEQLKELIGGDEESLVELIETFLSEGADIVSDMRQARTNNDIDLLRRSAHSLKSSAQDFGAHKLSELCAFLEYSCKTGWPEHATDQTNKIAEQYDIASNGLRDYLN